MAAISILVPIYNVEKYLDKCLNSISIQTFKDFEVICINDGSTDSSLEIIKKYVNSDKRFKVINKENTGYGHSMNLGLDNCQGKFVAIVESDDYIEQNMLEILYNISTQNDLDIARCNYKEISNETKLKVDLSWIPEKKVLKPLNNYVIFYQAPAIWVNLYRKAFLVENNIRFLETPGASFQDTSFIFKVYALCKRFMFINEYLLNYRVDNNTSSIHNKNKILCVCEEYREILRFAKTNDEIYESLKYHIPKLRLGCYAWNFSRLEKKDKKTFLKEWQKDLKSDFHEHRISRQYLSSKDLINLLIIRYFPFIYNYRKVI